MSLLESDIIKINILNVLNKSDNDLSMNLLRRKVGLVNYNSLVRNCEFLNLLDFINMDTKMIENRKYYFISITDSGRKHLELINKRCNNEKDSDQIIKEI